jgi:predicted DNA-binding antitoxin AbrB/MazE fold protein
MRRNEAGFVASPRLLAKACGMRSGFQQALQFDAKWKSLPRKNTDAEYTEGDAMTIPAKYEKGVFKPLQDVPIKEGTVVEVLLPAEAPAKRPPSIADSLFAGMWKDREDMADSVEYIDRLRRELHG